MTEPGQISADPYVLGLCREFGVCDKKGNPKSDSSSKLQTLVKSNLRVAKDQIAPKTLRVSVWTDPQNCVLRFFKSCFRKLYDFFGGWRASQNQEIQDLYERVQTELTRIETDEVGEGLKQPKIVLPTGTQYKSSLKTLSQALGQLLKAKKGKAENPQSQPRNVSMTAILIQPPSEEGIATPVKQKSASIQEREEKLVEPEQQAQEAPTSALPSALQEGAPPPSAPLQQSSRPPIEPEEKAAAPLLTDALAEEILKPLKESYQSIEAKIDELKNQQIDPQTNISQAQLSLQELKEKIMTGIQRLREQYDDLLRKNPQIKEDIERVNIVDLERHARQATETALESLWHEARGRVEELLLRLAKPIADYANELREALGRLRQDPLTEEEVGQKYDSIRGAIATAEKTATDLINSFSGDKQAEFKERIKKLQQQVLQAQEEALAAIQKAAATAMAVEPIPNPEERPSGSEQLAQGETPSIESKAEATSTAETSGQPASQEVVPAEHPFTETAQKKEPASIKQPESEQEKEAQAPEDREETRAPQQELAASQRPSSEKHEEVRAQPFWEQVPLSKDNRLEVAKRAMGPQGRRSPKQAFSEAERKRRQDISRDRELFHEYASDQRAALQKPSSEGETPTRKIVGGVGALGAAVAAAANQPNKPRGVPRKAPSTSPAVPPTTTLQGAEAQLPPELVERLKETSAPGKQLNLPQGDPSVELKKFLRGISVDQVSKSGLSFKIARFIMHGKIDHNKVLRDIFSDPDIEPFKLLFLTDTIVVGLGEHDVERTLVTLLQGALQNPNRTSHLPQIRQYLQREISKNRASPYAKLYQEILDKLPKPLPPPSGRKRK